MKKYGSGVMLLVPISLKPKIRKDVNYINTKKFESLWVECKLKNNSHNSENQLINVSYNPIKVLTGDFLEGLSTSIDYAVVENKPLTLMGDYNINYLNRKERNCLDTILTPNDLHVLNRTDPTRTKGASESIIDYIIRDLPNGNVFERYISDTLLRSKIMSDVDHRATSVLIKLEMKTTRKSIVKEIFEKSTYHPRG